ncbi:MAG: peptidyl-prolyl cis-trans isomerase [Gammaproteobacteria bacterium]|nr:peptidyl-prolyl cis-trans isomerase [Gammaproteobacteria bacterium]
MTALPRVRLTTSLGNIDLELFEAQAPETVANFLQYVADDFYRDTIFHRVIGNFMIQGGGLDAELRQKQTRAPIRNEASNGVANATGTIAMARTMEPHSATAQFFINVVDNTFLDHRDPSAQGWGYCVFGRVVDGMATVEAIRNVKTGTRRGMQDVPVETVTIHGAELLPQG